MVNPCRGEIEGAGTQDIQDQRILLIDEEVAAGIETGRNLPISDHWVYINIHDKRGRLCLGSNELPRSVYSSQSGGYGGPIIGTCTSCPKAWFLYPWQMGEAGRPSWHEISQQPMYANTA